jgi:hypothetical protein
VPKTIKATLRNEKGQFEANIELIGWEKAPRFLTLNVEDLGTSYKLECADVDQNRAHYESDRPSRDPP